MSIFENIAMALSGLVANKMRSLLTMLGIIIGIGSVIAIVTMGNSVSASVSSSFSNMGMNKLMVYVIQKDLTDDSVSYVRPKNSDYITDSMLEQYKSAFPDSVKDVAITEHIGTGKSANGKKYANINVIGVNQSYASAENITMLDGRFIIGSDVHRQKNVAVVSDLFVSNMFGGESPIGKDMTATINGEDKSFTIVGVYQYEDMMESGLTSKKDITTAFYIPSSSAKNISNATNGYLDFSVITAVGTDQAQFTEDTKNFFNRFYTDSENFKVEVYNMKDMLEEANSMMDTVTLAISAIAAISLLVGGIGVMNIMLVSITERTKEIGTRKALGAPNSAIRTQFIIESIIICLIGGLIGTIVGIILGSIGAEAMDYPASPSPLVIILAVGFSMVIGVFFGYYPANKAAKMNPIDALRYE